MSLIKKDSPVIEAIAADEIAMDIIKEEIAGYLVADGPDKAETFTIEVGQKLAEKGAFIEVVACFDYLVHKHTFSAKDKDRFYRNLETLLEGDRNLSTMIKYAGFQDKSRRIRPHHVFQRLYTLMNLKDGQFVYDKTWGFGVVSDVLLFDGKVEIDFDKKPMHLMAMTYAAETLELVDENHLLTKRHLNPEAFEEMIKKQPGEVIKLALQSFGPKPIMILQDLLVPDVVEESRWKRFWDNARKALKEDPLVVIPAKRSESIQLLATEKSFDDAWLASLSKNTDMDDIVQEIEAYVQQLKEPCSEEYKSVIGDRITFVIKGAEGKKHALMVRSIMLINSIGLNPEETGISDFIANLFEPRVFVEVVRALPAKDMKPFLKFLRQSDEERSTELFTSVINELEYSALNEIAQQLMKAGLEDSVAEAFKQNWNHWEVSTAGLLWLNQHPDKIESWGIGKIVDLIPRNLAELSKDMEGENLRSQNQIRELFAQNAWLKMMMEKMGKRQKRTMTQGIKDSTAWPKLDKASILGKIIKLHPEMQEIVSDKSASKEEQETPAAVSSFRMYREREKQLQKLVKEEIPANSKEIGVAREYGDLRENFEFKAAKDMQRMLLQRQAELEENLATVVPTTFEHFNTDVAGVGTHFRLKFDDGNSISYNILGEWDGDQDLHIISCNSKMAKSVTGFKPGDRVRVPTEQGDVECTLEAVEKLPQEVMDWANPPQEDA